MIFSPVVSGTADLADPGRRLRLVPAANPGIVSIPLGFLFGFLGTYLGRDKSSEDRYHELAVRSLTGAGAEGVAKH